jgi:hypothetical protein
MSRSSASREPSADRSIQNLGDLGLTGRATSSARPGLGGAAAGAVICSGMTTMLTGKRHDVQCRFRLHHMNNVDP